MANRVKDIKEKKPETITVGGQAVVEGVMMKGPRYIGITVRREDGTLARSCNQTVNPADKHPWMKWPIVRGVVNMALMLAMGVSTLDTATKLLGLTDEEKPSKFEEWLSRTFHIKIEKIVMGVAMALALGLSVLLFMVLPNLVASAANRAISSLLAVNLLAGLTRIVILIAYIWATGLIPDMKRVYQYHGAEHKTVYCYEAKLPLTVENARQFTTLHPRCGTSFLLLVMVVSVLLGAISDQLIALLFGIPRMSFPLRLLRSFLILPLVAGVGYDALQYFAKHENGLCRALRWPGMQLQRLTTREPDDGMLEVAIDAAEQALCGPKAKPAADAPAIPAPDGDPLFQEAVPEAVSETAAAPAETPDE